MPADGHVPAKRRKLVRVSRDAQRREIAAVDAGYSHDLWTLRVCGLCGRAGYEVLAATTNRAAECMSSTACADRAARRGAL